MTHRLSELWLEHMGSKFPKGYGGKDVAGICVTLLDSDVAGCVSSYIKNSASEISIDHILVLKKSKVDLEAILKYLDDDALVYFRRLYDMCELVLKEAAVA